MEKTEKVLKSFKELKKEWGMFVLMHHLIRKTKLKEKELRPILEELKAKKLISEPRKNWFVDDDYKKYKLREKARTITLPDSLIKKMNKVIKENKGGYISREELAKDAIRKLITNLEKK